MDEYEQALNIYHHESRQYNAMLRDPVHYGLNPGDIPEKQKAVVNRASEHLISKRNEAFTHTPAP